MKKIYEFLSFRLSLLFFLSVIFLAGKSYGQKYTWTNPRPKDQSQITVYDKEGKPVTSKLKSLTKQKYNFYNSFSFQNTNSQLYFGELALYDEEISGNPIQGEYVLYYGLCINEGFPMPKSFGRRPNGGQAHYRAFYSKYKSGFSAKKAAQLFYLMKEYPSSYKESDMQKAVWYLTREISPHQDQGERNNYVIEAENAIGNDQAKIKDYAKNIVFMKKTTPILDTDVQDFVRWESTLYTMGGVVWSDDDDNGSIHTQRERGVEGVKVFLYPDFNGDGKPDVDEPIATTTTNYRGEYSFQVIDANYLVEIEIPLGYEAGVLNHNDDPNYTHLDDDGAHVIGAEKNKLRTNTVRSTFRKNAPRKSQRSPLVSENMNIGFGIVPTGKAVLSIDKKVKLKNAADSEYQDQMNVKQRDELTYRIVVTNTSNKATAQNVTITDVLPSIVEYQDGSATKTYNITKIIQPAKQTGVFTHNMGAADMSDAPEYDGANSSKYSLYKQSYRLTPSSDPSIPEKAKLTNFSFVINGESKGLSGKQDLSLLAKYPSGFVKVKKKDFGKGTGRWNTIRRSEKVYNEQLFGLYEFVYRDDYLTGSKKNYVTSAEFEAKWEYTPDAYEERQSETNPAHAPTDLVVSTDNVTLLPGESITVVYNVTVKSDAATGSYETIAKANGENVKGEVEDGATIVIPVTTRSITGKLLVDTNGTKESGEEGLEGKAITLKDNTGKVIATTTTDSDGTYSFTGVPQGDYTISYDKSELGDEYYPVWDSEGIAPYTELNVTVGDQDVTNTEFIVKEYATVGGYVLDDTNNNGIIEVGPDAGLENVVVELYNESGAKIVETKTNVDGKYSFDKIEQGVTYTVKQKNLAGYEDVTNSAGTTSNEVTFTSNDGSTTNDYINFLDRKIPDNKVYAVGDINQTLKNTGVWGNILTNDRDFEGDNITLKSFSNIEGESIEPASNGTEINAYSYDENRDAVEAGVVTVYSDGRYYFEPKEGFTGELIAFTYEIQDDNTNQAFDTADLVIKVVPKYSTVKKNKPLAQNDYNATKKGVTIDFGNDNIILSNDSDIDTPKNRLVVKNIMYNDPGNGETTVSAGTLFNVMGTNEEGKEQEAGTLTIRKDGTYKFVPTNDFVGRVKVGYTIIDDENGDNVADAGEASALLVIDVYEVDANQNITLANDDANQGKKGETLSGNVLTNDFDPEGNAIAVESITYYSTKSGGEATSDMNVSDVNVYGDLDKGGTYEKHGEITLDKQGNYQWIPESNFEGTAVVKYAIKDDATQKAIGRATLYLTTSGKNICTKTYTVGRNNGETKVGISTLKRNTDGAWVTGAKNGFLKLESRSKAFVPTRLQNETKIENPVEGMMFWNIDKQCMMIRTDTEWKCTSKGCNE